MHNVSAAPEARALAQFIYAGKKATLHIGNVLPVGDMPEGTIICNVEEVKPQACITGPVLPLHAAAVLLWRECTGVRDQPGALLLCWRMQPWPAVCTCWQALGAVVLADPAA